MGITIAEFQAAMEIYGAKRLPDENGTRYSFSVPCFAVGDVEFLHSGSYYIVPRGCEVSEEIMNQAMSEFGEKHPGRDNFWYGEIHSVKGILTLAAMLEGKYSKELVNNLANETYKKLLDCSAIQHNIEVFDSKTKSSKMKKLCKKISELDSLVNPFGNSSLNIKEPIEYLDNLKFSLATRTSENVCAFLTVKGRSAQIKYDNDSDGWAYNAEVSAHRNRKNCYINMIHYCKDDDEVIYLDFNADRTTFGHPDDIDLRISLKTGLAWRTYREKQAAPATDEQIDVMITHLNICIKKIKQRIISYMLNQ